MKMLKKKIFYVFNNLIIFGTFYVTTDLVGN